MLFADDTMITAKDNESLTGLLWTVELVSGKYGLKLNKGKCMKVINKQEDSRIHFEDGSELARAQQADYLGTGIVAKTDAAREVNRRITMARVAESQLTTYWREGRVSRKWRIIMYNAIVGTKLSYGLEALPMNDTLYHKLDASYYRGLRRILNMKSTYMDRSKENTNAEVMTRALKELNGAMEGSWQELRNSQDSERQQRTRQRKMKNADDILPSSKVRNKAVRLLHEILTADSENLLKQVTLNSEGDAFNLPQKLRVGRPRVNWVIQTAKMAWRRWGGQSSEAEREFDHEKTEMVKRLVQLAVERGGGTVPGEHS